MSCVRLTFHGAARAVTGSCFRLETAAGQILIDCGLYQGSKSEKELNYREFPFSPRDIDAVILTHAHIDHSGLLPKLVRDGFGGPIYSTGATAELSAVMLPDSAHIQEIEVEQLNRRNARRHRASVEPIYTAGDVDKCIKLFDVQDFKKWCEVLPGVRARFWNAGHLLGSASVELEVQEQGREAPMRLLFSGDIGPDFKLLHSDPEAPSGVDYVVCESTYGDTDRTDLDEDQRRALLCSEVRAAMHPDGVLLIPSFAVERAQELISDLTRLIAEGELPMIPIYVDSPLAEKATNVFARNWQQLKDGAMLVHGLKSRALHFTESVEQSIALDRLRGFHIIIAASGMCEAGRIRYRLKNWLWRDEATVLLVGYQAVGTLGRILQEGASSVRIQGQDFKVRARIRTIDFFSGHADGPQLVDWIAQRLPISQGLFLVHGEDDAIAGLMNRLSGRVDQERIAVPVLDETFELSKAGAKRLPGKAVPRLPADRVARIDWHNDVTALFLDVNDALALLPDEKTRAILIRKLRRVLEDHEPAQAPPARSRLKKP
ncbi:MAG: MBL fold metallo-hydrolase [Alphaproteobacteria bacterium BRH_c36]|nr:MAG: MBL fold metallo-hydrolase [Alphaproteobacteria bacterium BRH_c36]